MGNDLNKLFLILENNAPLPFGEEDLFGYPSASQQSVTRKYNRVDLELIASFYSSDFNPCALEEPARRFFELCADAFTAFLHAWMSELPIEAEMLAFGRKVMEAQDRREAERAVSDRGDNDTLTVLNTAAKVQFEIHRMYGLLRFFPDSEGVYIARFAPDFLILPALGGYFTARFGETPWVIIDEKRRLVLSRLNPENGSPRRTEIQVLDASVAENPGNSADEWENLWRHYHKTINNESRNNPDLQRQLMPKRYWKYLPEV
jgi:probable DNA metabolism protein